MSKYCHPSYTVEECNLYCKQNPGACSNQVPEPGMFALLAIGFIAAWVVRKAHHGQG